MRVLATPLPGEDDPFLTVEEIAVLAAEARIPQHGADGVIADGCHGPGREHRSLAELVQHARLRGADRTALHVLELVYR